MLAYAIHEGRRDKWPICDTSTKPTPAMIRRAGIDPQSVIRIAQVRPHRGAVCWLVILPRTSRTFYIRPRGGRHA